MNRKEFIQKSVFTGMVASLSPALMAAQLEGKRRKVTILHTNDTHSNIDPFPDNHAKFPGMGGVARRFELVQRIRSEEEVVFLLDAGDIFQGTPYFNRYGGELEMKVMTQLGYDAATMGNHDFDGGMDGFVKAKQHANFPFICSNYDFTNTVIHGQTEPFKILKKGGVTIALFGLGVGLKGLVPDRLYGETKYLDPVETAQEMVGKLKAQRPDLIICLSHLGYSYQDNKISDLLLAQQTEGIDLIIGGHTHTFLDKPTEVINRSGQLTLVNQVGWGGLQLGRIDIDLERTRDKSCAVLEVAEKMSTNGK